MAGYLEGNDVEETRTAADLSRKWLRIIGWVDQDLRHEKAELAQCLLEEVEQLASDLLHGDVNISPY